MNIKLSDIKVDCPMCRSDDIEFTEGEYGMRWIFCQECFWPYSIEHEPCPKCGNKHDIEIGKALNYWTHEPTWIGNLCRKCGEFY